MSSRQPYHGPHRKLVLAFDVGTTYSGVSYSILDPGLVPEIQGVTRYAIQVISDERCLNMPQVSRSTESRRRLEDTLCHLL